MGSSIIYQFKLNSWKQLNLWCLNITEQWLPLVLCVMGIWSQQGLFIEKPQKNSIASLIKETFSRKRSTYVSVKLHQIFHLQWNIHPSKKKISTTQLGFATNKQTNKQTTEANKPNSLALVADGLYSSAKDRPRINLRNDAFLPGNKHNVTAAILFPGKAWKWTKAEVKI